MYLVCSTCHASWKDALTVMRHEHELPLKTLPIWVVLFFSDNIQDIMSMLIAVQKEFDADPSESGTSQFTDKHFVMIIRDIFGGKFVNI